MSALSVLLADLRLIAGFRAVTESAFLRAVGRVWDELLAEEPKLNSGTVDVVFTAGTQSMALANMTQVLAVHLGTSGGSSQLMATSVEALDANRFGWRRDLTAATPTEYYLEGSGSDLLVCLPAPILATTTLRCFGYLRRTGTIGTSSTIPSWVKDDELFLIGAKAKLAPQYVPSMSIAFAQEWDAAKMSEKFWMRTLVERESRREDVNARDEVGGA